MYGLIYIPLGFLFLIQCLSSVKYENIQEQESEAVFLPLSKMS